VSDELLKVIVGWQQLVASDEAVACACDVRRAQNKSEQKAKSHVSLELLVELREDACTSGS
jgi:hypothetical protein